MFVNQNEFLKKITLYFPEILYFSIGKQSFIRISVDQVWNLIYFLKYHTYSLFKQLIDLSCIDYPERKYRFELFYHLLSMKYNSRLTITTTVPEDTYVDSITNIYPAAN
jgi:NADH:ubiquinone oxidoreductase subunit C